MHKIFRIKSNGYYWRPLCGQDILWRPTVNQLKFDWQIAENQQWQKQFSIPINLKIPIQLFEFCKKGSSYFGLPLNEKFICLHVREGGYHGDWDNIRIADINKYRAAIEIITSKAFKNLF